ncbi:hypothetical protein [Gloeothece verrucosa]|uniref:Uncharacterized protein n=1 Tax=Gloeothece verrucosa (strain PCC 7822) TaxID=497965 RepID=E0UAG0_GLOV7|nr:hypothetical protein [Gloeothece verrucosa]ADN12701.1 hypothetical protein Cyan7822_0665 [Gloeothece verrucosa PCC 7822]
MTLDSKIPEPKFQKGEEVKTPISRNGTYFRKISFRLWDVTESGWVYLFSIGNNEVEYFTEQELKKITIGMEDE